jgi:Calpain family cysteine protease
MTSTNSLNIVGARNPYAYAELKEKGKIDWINKSAEEKARVLEKAFGRPYSKLFDPVYGSSLFPKSGSSSATLPLTGDAVSCNPNPCPAMDDFLQLPNASFFVSKERYDDLIQGCLPDCYFIAALCSYAWASRSQAAFQNKIEANNYSYTFYAPKTDAIGNIILDAQPVADPAFTVNDKIPLIRPDNTIFSRSVSANEIWPCIYEKAYATWIHCRKNKIAPGPDVRPDYLNICQGNPVSTLIHLTGKTAVSYDTKNLADGDCYARIGLQVTPAASTKPGSPVQIKTNYPTVAWTYATAPAGVSYRNDVIVANHSYSVLGVYPQLIPADAKKYVVLRNPFGQKSGDPRADVDPNLPADAYFTGAWGPLKDAAGNQKMLGDPADGIFAIKDSVFRKYFAGFGWVKY